MFLHHTVLRYCPVEVLAIRWRNVSGVVIAAAVHLLNGAKAEIEESWLHIAEPPEGAADDPSAHNRGLVVVGSGTKANVTSCIINACKWDEEGCEDAVIAVAAHNNAVVTAQN